MIVGVPVSYEEAMQVPNSGNWQKAMSEEMSSVVDNDTFEVTTVQCTHRNNIPYLKNYAVKEFQIHTQYG